MSNDPDRIALPAADDGEIVAPIVHGVLLFVQLTFSGMHVLGKIVLEHLDPFALAAIRVVVATPVLLLFAWRHDRCRPTARDLPVLALLGLLGVCLNQLLFITGLQRTTATNSAILMTSIPVFAVGLGAALRIERVGRARLLGVGLSVLGALVVLDPRSFSLARDSSVGDLLVLLNCLSYAAFLVLQRPVLERLPWRTVLAWAYLFGGALVLLVGWPELGMAATSSYPPSVGWGVTYIALFPTILGYTLATWAVRRSTPTVVAAYTTLQPLGTALLALPLLGEQPSGRQLAGFLLIAVGLWWVGRRTSARSPG